jgi:hypothetical protein
VHLYKCSNGEPPISLFRLAQRTVALLDLRARQAARPTAASLADLRAVASRVGVLSAQLQGAGPAGDEVFDVALRQASGACSRSSTLIGEVEDPVGRERDVLDLARSEMVTAGEQFGAATARLAELGFTPS